MKELPTCEFLNASKTPPVVCGNGHSEVVEKLSDTSDTWQDLNFDPIRSKIDLVDPLGNAKCGLKGKSIR